MPVSFKPEVIADSTGEWIGNSLRFATRKEAEDNVRDLMGRWFAVRDTRVVESEDAVNYSYADGQLVKVTELPAPTYANQIAAAEKLLSEKGREALNNPHAMTGRICGCGDCFCCAAAEVVHRFDRMHNG